MLECGSVLKSSGVLMLCCAIVLGCVVMLGFMVSDRVTELDGAIV